MNSQAGRSAPPPTPVNNTVIQTYNRFLDQDRKVSEQCDPGKTLAKPDTVMPEISRPPHADNAFAFQCHSSTCGVI